jgi:hypothetical protein
MQMIRSFEYLWATQAPVVPSMLLLAAGLIELRLYRKVRA